jgi:hypothetical protein
LATKVPMLTIAGHDLLLDSGRLLRIGRIVGDTYVGIEDPKAIIQRLKECGTRVDLFTFTQLLPDISTQFGYPVEWDNWAVIEVSTYEHWRTKQIDSKTRNMIRKAEKKGVVVREVPFDDLLVEGIWEVYNECPVRQGKRNRHYGLDKATVRKLEATLLSNSIFLGAFFEDKMVGFAKLVIDRNQRQVKIMNLLAMVEYREKAPMNALVAEAVRSCAERGIPYCVYGSFTYGKKQNDSFTSFKSNNGFGPVLLPRYYVPLNSIGSLALRLGLQHRLRDRLPESFASKLRFLRSKWYGKMLRSFRTAS